MKITAVLGHSNILQGIKILLTLFLLHPLYNLLQGLILIFIFNAALFLEKNIGRFEYKGVKLIFHGKPIVQSAKPFFVNLEFHAYHNPSSHSRILPDSTMVAFSKENANKSRPPLVLSIFEFGESSDQALFHPPHDQHCENGFGWGGNNSNFLNPPPYPLDRRSRGAFQHHIFRNPQSKTN